MNCCDGLTAENDAPETDCRSLEALREAANRYVGAMRSLAGTGPDTDDRG